MSLRSLLFRRPVEPRTIEVPFDGAVYRVRLRRHRQARRYTLRIQAATREVVLTLPSRGSIKEATDFAGRHGAWIAARLGRLPEQVSLEHGTVVPLRGVSHRIVHRPGVRGTVWTEQDGDGNQLLCVAGDAAHTARRITDFFKREVRRDVERASRRYARELDVTIKRIGVRDQVSRWGSCSSGGALSYSWRLIFAPPHVLDYIAAHEVAHLVEMNHSPRFWRLVERLCPDLRRAKAWLDVHGKDLHRYGEQKGSGHAAHAARRPISDESDL
jgi:predicted metal-dependent hydrolase